MRRIPTLAALAVLFSAAPVAAQSLKPDEIFSSIAVQPVSAPDPVLGADGRTHLAYELEVVNPSELFITLDKVEAVDGAGRSLWAIDGERLAKLTKLYAGEGRTLPPGGSAVVFMDVGFARGEAPPPLGYRAAPGPGQGSDSGPLVAPLLHARNGIVALGSNQRWCFGRLCAIAGTVEGRLERARA